MKGKACLLSYSSPKVWERYFIRLENDSLYELKNTTRTVERNGFSYTVDNNEYKGALNYYFRACPSIFQDIKKLSYSNKSMIDITKEYHEKMCGNDDCIVYEAKKKKLSFAVGASLSYLGSKLTFNNGIPEHTKFSNTVGAGVVFSISHLPLVSPKLSFQTAVEYFNSVYKYENIVGPTYYYYLTGGEFCQIKYLWVPLQFSYIFTQKKLNPYVFAGLDINFRLSHTFENQELLNYITKHYDYELGLSLVQVGISGGFGLEYIISTNLTTKFGLEYQVAPSFFGTYVPENSLNNNLLIHLSFCHTIK